jgi:hypothetical protein
VFSTLPVHGDPLTYAQPGRPDYADRRTPEYERIVAKMGSVFPYARARTLLEEFLPLDEVPAVETTRRRTPSSRRSAGAAGDSEAIPRTGRQSASNSLTIDGGHVRAVRSYQVRSFGVMLAQISNDDGNRLSSAVCLRRLIGNGTSSVVCCMGWERRRRRPSPS